MTTGNSSAQGLSLAVRLVCLAHRLHRPRCLVILLLQGRRFPVFLFYLRVAFKFVSAVAISFVR